jgi:hypothetical protein
VLVSQLRKGSVVVARTDVMPGNPAIVAALKGVGADMDKAMLRALGSPASTLYTIEVIGEQTQVRKTLSWPRSWANFSLLSLYSHMNTWANSHLLG